MDWLNGKKTMLASVGGILLVAGNFLQGGSFDFSTLIAYVQEALPFIVAIFLRDGIRKAEKNG